MKKNIFYLKSLVAIIVLSGSCACSAFAETTYHFDRVWPFLEHPYYFNYPSDVAVDSEGDIYVADTHHNRIVKFSSARYFVKSWGEGGDMPGQMSRPAGVAVDAAGDVYVADTGNDRIQKFSRDGEFIHLWGEFGSEPEQFRAPRSIDVDLNGYVWVADEGNNRIAKYMADGNLVGLYGEAGTEDGQFDAPVGIAADQRGFVYVSDQGNHRIQKFTNNGEFAGKWGVRGPLEGQFDNPGGLATTPEGIVVVADTSNNRIQMFTSDGDVVGIWGEWGVGDGLLYEPLGLDIDNEGFVYIADTSNNRIQGFDQSGAFLGKMASSGGEPGEFNYPSGVATDGENNIYVADELNDRIQVFGPDGDYRFEWGKTGADVGEFYQPRGIAVAQDGSVYVGDTYNRRVQKFDPQGGFILSWGSAGGDAGQFNEYEGVGYLALHPSGDVYVTDPGNHRVQQFGGEGEFINQWGGRGHGEGEFEHPTGIGIDSAGNVFVADSYNSRVQKFTAGGEFVSIIGAEEEGFDPGFFVGPVGLAFDESDHLFVADAGNSRVQIFDPDGELQDVLGGLGSEEPGMFSEIVDLAIDSDGRLITVENGTNRVQVFVKGDVEDPNNGNGETEGKAKAIIVAGGGPYQGNVLWDATQMVTTYAYRALLYQGFSKADIYYLSADTGLDVDGNGKADDVDADATNANFQAAIASWASDAEDLFIFMLDHGADGKFRMSGTEILEAKTLDGWLDAFQQTRTGNLAVVYDACRSGSFLPLLTPTEGKTRILATSCASSQEAIFLDKGTISFSFLFWARIFNGDGFYEAYVSAKNGMDVVYGQTSQLDGNGNGIGNEKEDQTAARAVVLGRGIQTGLDVPNIVSVSPAQSLTDVNYATIYAEVSSLEGIDRVWAVTTPPGFSGSSPDTPVTSLPALDLSHAGGDRYEAVYTGFASAGTYKVAVYALDWNGGLAAPKSTTVTVSGTPGGISGTLYYPMVISDGEWETEVAVVNVDSSLNLNGSFTAYDKNGQPEAPVLSVSLPPRGRSQLTVGQSFSTPKDIAYIVFKAEAGSASGYIKNYRTGKYRAAVPAADTVNTGDAYISHIASTVDWKTQIGLLNTAGQPKTVTLSFNTGQEKSIALGAGAFQRFAVSELFGGVPQPDIESAVVEGASGIVGTVLFYDEGNNIMGGIPIMDKLAAKMFYPHIATTDGWGTGVVAYNPSDTQTTLNITPYDSTGRALSPQTVTVPGGGKYVGVVSKLGFSKDTAWIGVNADSPVTGFELFTQSNQMAGYSGVDIAATEGVFPKLEKAGNTGIAFVNVSQSAAMAILTAYDDNGSPVAAGATLLDPGQKRVAVAEKLFTQDISNATYIHYSCDREVVGFQLNVSSDGMLLDGLPGN